MKNYNNYDSKKLQTHERKDKAKWIIAFTCIILLIVAVGFIGFSVYFDNADKQPANDVVVQPQGNLSALSNANIATVSDVELLASNSVDVYWQDDDDLILTVTDYSATTGKIHFVSHMKYETASELWFYTNSSYSGAIALKLSLWDGTFSTYDVNLYDLINKGKLKYDTTYYLYLDTWDYDSNQSRNNLFSFV